MKSLMVSAAVVLAAVAALPAQAAQLVDVSGQVLVNRGDGFKPVAGGAQLNVGDRVLVKSGAAARISYSSTCVTPVAANTVVTVIAASPCEGRMRQAGGPDGISTETMVIGGVLVAGGVGAAIILSNDDKKKGVSP